jgi:uncharacterized protein YodC (DUF2158 family)
MSEEFKVVGDVVQLKCGGPAMVISNLVSEDHVECLWSSEGLLQSRVIAMGALKLHTSSTILVGVHLGRNITLKSALKACKEYETFLDNAKIKIHDSEDVKFRVLPIIGEDGQLNIYTID